MLRKKNQKNSDVRFENVKIICPRCKNTQNEVVIVSKSVGVIDVSCKKCKKRILDIKFFQ